MPDDVPAGAAPPPRPRPDGRAWRISLTVVAVVVLTVCGLLSLGAVTMEIGLSGLLPGVLLAAVPVGPVLATVVWLDRYEAEPPHLLAFAFGWGACVASLGALVLNSLSYDLLMDSVGDVTNTSVVVAPVVEEVLKGLGVLLLVLLQRKQFDGIVDGIVYAAFVGVGFAFLENILYLGRALGSDGGAGLVVVFVLRCLVSPFAHPLFTMAVGIGLGVAVRGRGPLRRVGAPVLGLLVAIALHALWNLSASGAAVTFIELYLLLQLPVFACAIGVAVAARVRESRLVARQLQVYVRTGWLTGEEMYMLSSPARRRDAVRWARQVGGRTAALALRDFQETATELAFRRDRVARGVLDPAPGAELLDLQRLAACRSVASALL